MNIELMTREQDREEMMRRLEYNSRVVCDIIEKYKKDKIKIENKDKQEEKEIGE